MPLTGNKVVGERLGGLTIFHDEAAVGVGRDGERIVVTLGYEADAIFYQLVRIEPEVNCPFCSDAIRYIQ